MKRFPRDVRMFKRNQLTVGYEFYHLSSQLMKFKFIHRNVKFVQHSSFDILLHEHRESEHRFELDHREYETFLIQSVTVIRRRMWLNLKREPNCRM